MKKHIKAIISIILSLSLCFSLCSCGSGSSSESQDKKIGMLLKTNITNENMAGIGNNSHTLFFEDLNSLILALKSGKIDEISIIDPSAKYITKTNDEFAISSYEGTDLLREYAYAMCLMESNKDLCNQISKTIVSMKEDGTLKSLQDELINNEDVDFSSMNYTLSEFPGEDTLRVGITGDLPPMDYINSDGTPQGFNIAFLSELSKRMKINIEIVDLTSGSRAIALTSDKVDALFWTAILKSEEFFVGEKWGDTPKNSVVTESYFETANCGVVKK